MIRVISGVVLAAATLAAIVFLPFAALRMLTSIVAGLGAVEFAHITGAARSLLARALVIAITVWACWWSAVPAPLSIVLVSLLVIAWLAIEVLREGRTFQQAAVDLVAPIYIGAPLGMLVALHMRSGPKAVLLLIATIVISDSAQYYTGRAFGKRPLAPTISPKKTIEGAIGGVLFGTLFMALALPLVFPLTPLLLRVLLGAAVVVFGIVGDLFESRLKRLADMKDSSHLIPGHGGVLDRIDALLFAIPVFYFMVVQGRVA
jgi:phosphatidate cytidylyltransferase